MCAMLLCGAEGEINPVFSPSVKISDSRRVDEAVRAAYQAMLRPETDTQNATFTMKRI
jgi:hypothetical protein